MLVPHYIGEYKESICTVSWVMGAKQIVHCMPRPPEERCLGGQCTSLYNGACVCPLVHEVGQIERVFSSASHQKVWDHFTKAQRKNISMWKKQAGEIRSMQLEEAINERADEEMDVSDSDNESDVMNAARKKQRFDDDRGNPNNIFTLKEENDSLRCQLEAYKNEVDLIRADTRSESEQRDAQFKLLQQTLHNAQQQLLDTSRKLMEREGIIKDLEAKIANGSTSDNSKDQCTKDSNNSASVTAISEATEDSESCDTKAESAVTPASDSPVQAGSGVPSLILSSAFTLSNVISERDAKLIGLISTFLHVHPFGAGLDYVWSYLQKVEANLRPSEVEALMSRFPSVFRHELSGIGANMERKWVFVGFDVTRVSNGLSN